MYEGDERGSCPLGRRQVRPWARGRAALSFTSTSMYSSSQVEGVPPEGGTDCFVCCRRQLRLTHYSELYFGAIGSFPCRCMLFPVWLPLHKGPSGAASVLLASIGAALLCQTVNPHNHRFSAANTISYSTQTPPVGALTPFIQLSARSGHPSPPQRVG